MPKRNDGEENHTGEAHQISVQTPIALGLFIGFAALCVGGFGSSIWWASSISTKMDVLVKQGAEQSNITLANSSRITALEMWQRQIEAVGSPAMVKRVDSVEKDVIQLGEELRLHKAISQNGK